MKQTLTLSSIRLQLFIWQYLRMLIALVALNLASPFVAMAQTDTPEPLPPAAQEAVDNGIIAAKLPDYLLAIRYFDEARKIAPTAPIVYLNLGLAESRIPGRELRAIAWFGAYLTAYPDAPNAEAVKEQINVLSVKNQSIISGLIQAIEDGASQIPEDTELPTMGRDKEHILAQVSMLWAKIGDIERAQKSAEPIQREIWSTFALKAIAEAQFLAGDVAGASQTAGRIQDQDEASAMQKAIAEAAANTQPTSNTAIEVDDWLKEMDVGTWPKGVSKVPWIHGSLITNIFLDLDGHLKSLPPPTNDIYAYYWALQETAENIVKARNTISELQRQQTLK